MLGIRPWRIMGLALIVPPREVMGMSIIMGVEV